jgi:hypothetical protein
MLPPSIDHILSMQFAPHFYVEDKSGIEVDYGYWAHTTESDEPEDPPLEIFSSFLFYGKIRAGEKGWVEYWWNDDNIYDKECCDDEECSCCVSD